jgi:inhibitor of cysteine peptidase
MNDKNLKISGLFLASIIIIVSFVYSMNMQPVVTGESVNFIPKYSDLKTFSSYNEFTRFLKETSQTSYYWPSSAMRVDVDSQDMAADFSNFDLLNSISKEGGELVDYSQTNVQVAGVDEPDIVKTDGIYLYIVSNNKVIIVKANPADDAEIISEITVDSSHSIINIFISGDRLVIFCNNYNYPILYDEPVFIQPISVDDSVTDEDSNEIEKITDDIVSPVIWYSSPETHILVYDLQDLNNPEEVKNVVVPGHFSGSRLIGDFVYLITNQYSYELYNLDENYSIIPRIMINSEVQDIALDDIIYVDILKESKTLTNIVSVNIHDDEQEVNAKIYLLGNSQVLYVSKENIYITYYSSNYDYNLLQTTIQEVLTPLLPDNYKSEIEQIKSFATLNEYQKKTVTEWILQNFTNSLTEEEKMDLHRELILQFERTTIHRIAIKDGEITYESQGQVPGQVSNQFSLSEWNGILRVSSTTQGWMFRSILNSFIETQNNIYVLDMDLEIIGKLEGLAPGETIYATRFLIDKCYLVTFRQIDPFFVIDLSDPRNPEVLGELKIPGYSTYLHPYDSTHIIGIGMENNNIKISLFDVVDVQNPVELSKYIIKQDDNDWGWGQSYALSEHKAFLFDKEKNLLVIPAGDYYKQSAYVFNITLEGGLELKGVIEHGEETTNYDEYNYYWYSDYGNSIKRTLYINDVLYTISDNLVKMNNLQDLSEINTVELN